MFLSVMVNEWHGMTQHCPLKNQLSSTTTYFFIHYLFQYIYSPFPSYPVLWLISQWFTYKGRCCFFFSNITAFSFFFAFSPFHALTGLVEIYHHFSDERGTPIFREEHSHLYWRWAQCPTETSVNFYHITSLNTPQDDNPQWSRYLNIIYRSI